MHSFTFTRKCGVAAYLFATVLSASAAQPQSLQLSEAVNPALAQITTSETTAGPELVVQADTAKVFGQNLFDGGFRQVAFKGFNQNYRIAIGDKITLQMWGAYEVTAELTVDAQGNIFIPQVGPVTLQGVANKDLNRVVAEKVSSVYQSNVNLYASLNATQPVKLFVTGFVARPGLYGGFASDSALAFLANAGGIRAESGSYLNVELKRNGQTRAIFNLYDFLLRGEIEQVQLQDGDTLVVGSRQSTAGFDGLVENPVQIEFADGQIPLKQALNIVGLLPEATHVRITRNQTSKRNVEYLPLTNIDDVVLASGDEITVVSDKMPGTISVAVEGEHNGQAIYVLPYGSTIETLEQKLKLNSRSNYQALQLFRKEVAERQKEVLEVTLQQLEQVTLSARSSTDGEAKLRKADADSILKFIDRARKLKPRGQVLLGQSEQKNDVLLKDGDRLVIPGETVLVQVHGEVMFPNAMVYRKDARLLDYIESAGGFNQKADQSRLLVMHQDGTITRIEKKDGWFSGGYAKAGIQPGDEIMVMPQVDIKSFQYTRDVIDTIYKVALSTAVVAGL
ncbi:polysaccharide biosynthesis/export family protein [Sansalvadorimonas sp. 2012CJ34-2]|uniref:Polysaccharide biosynthesis/export family protein n=1 Tax=Parendozoicomonas callyspongiae TaxID=2942213 RepID=A0ABT0PHB2_9GAMM|nr:polysaccharide biosynthesis/export family protein [Sansalvadorimonas sp. 2012CJ34-2]MCL6270767.1 polysaccharide biosynthesis/export family protein [Sansalvadorimonas sp. 2012CJ34-2]